MPGTTIVPGTVIDQPVAPAVPGAVNRPAVDAPKPGPRDGTSINSATIIVSVPAEARVFVNGKVTSSTGTVRRYVSHNLEAGFSYTYELRAEMVVDGRVVAESKSITVRAGEAADLAFNFDADAQEKVADQKGRTNLTLKVPADARVTLAGSATQSFGEVREFSTARLAAGQEWNNYVVRVELDRDGQKLVKEQTLTLRGGESRELSFDFDVAQVARAN